MAKRLPPDFWTSERDQRIRDQAATGRSLTALSKEMGLGVETVRRRAKILGVKFYTNWHAGKVASSKGGKKSAALRSHDRDPQAEKEPPVFNDDDVREGRV